MIKYILLVYYSTIIAKPEVEKRPYLKSAVTCLTNSPKHKDFFKHKKGLKEPRKTLSSTDDN